MVINEKGVGKNVNAAPVQGSRAGTSTTHFTDSSRPSGRSRCLSGARSSGLSRRAAAGMFCTLLLGLSALSAGLVPADASARSAPRLGDPVALSSLPREAQETERLILSGGPFPYPKDGVVFGNYEKRLERRPRGYYHEYTVPSPRVRNRGARRIVCGGMKPTEPDACFYTEDHYNSFHRIVK